MGILLLGFYMLPTIIGASRKVVNIGSIAAINLLLGRTLIGWVVALAMALRTNPPQAYQQYWQNAGPEAGSPRSQERPMARSAMGLSWPWAVRAAAALLRYRLVQGSLGHEHALVERHLLDRPDRRLTGAPCLG